MCVFLPVKAKNGLANRFNDFIIDSPIMNSALKNAGIDPSSTQAKLAKDIAKDGMGSGDISNIQNRVNDYMDAQSNKSHNKVANLNSIHPMTLNSIGLRYYNAGKDVSEAKSYWEMAAKLGNKSALYNLSILYFEGKGNVKSDITKAKGYAIKAMNKGHRSAKDLLIVYDNTSSYTNDWIFFTTSLGEKIRIADNDIVFDSPTNGSVKLLQIVDFASGGLIFALQSDAGYYELPNAYSKSMSDHVEKIIVEDLNHDNYPDIIVFASSRYKYEGHKWSKREQANRVFISTDNGHYYTDYTISSCCTSLDMYKKHFLTDSNINKKGIRGRKGERIFKATIDCKQIISNKQTSTKVEKLICNRERNINAESAMANTYLKLSKILPKKDKIKLIRNQEEWLKSRDNFFTKYCKSTLLSGKIGYKSDEARLGIIINHRSLNLQSMLLKVNDYNSSSTNTKFIIQMEESWKEDPMFYEKMLDVKCLNEMPINVKMVTEIRALMRAKKQQYSFVRVIDSNIVVARFRTPQGQDKGHQLLVENFSNNQNITFKIKSDNEILVNISKY